jgi:putative ABC transport system substrate-binding protein
MRRREIIAGLACATTAWPFSAQGQKQEPVHRVGVLANTETPEEMQAWLEGLREHGYVGGRNLQIEYRYSQAQSERIPALVAELVALGPEVIVTVGPQQTVAVHAAAPTIPLVFLFVADPVALGLVESLAHPGGNVTGFATVVPEGFTGKQLQLLKELVPRASRIAVLLNPENPMTQRFRPDLPEIGRQVGVALVVVEASQPDQLDTAFETAHTQGAEAIHVLGDPLTNRHSAKVAGLAARYRLPTMYLYRPSVLNGGLISYGPDLLDFWRRAGGYVDKILKGERPGDLPVEQPTRFNLIVNLKTATALGITIPPSILAQANEVIE